MFEDPIEELKPVSAQEIGEIIQDGRRVLPRGGGTKSSLSTPPAGYSAMDLSGLSGILEYQSDEMTFTALAGTPIKQIIQHLAKNNQYLPFDPPLATSGATLGGTVATGVSGPGRYQYGGIRDFLLGVRFIDSYGQTIRSGGKVVKNAAGFDLTKLMIGSRGGLGILLELSFKVFPLPDDYVTYSRDYADLTDALEAIGQITNAGLNLAALDLEAISSGYRIWVRLGGYQDGLSGKQARLETLMEPDDKLRGAAERRYWSNVNNIEWIEPDKRWVVVPITPSCITDLEQILLEVSAPRRYLSAGQALWVALDGGLEGFGRQLNELGLSGLVLTGAGRKPIIGKPRIDPFLRRVKSAIDPESCFVEV